MTTANAQAFANLAFKTQYENVPLLCKTKINHLLEVLFGHKSISVISNSKAGRACRSR